MRGRSIVAASGSTGATVDTLHPFSAASSWNTPIGPNVDYQTVAGFDGLAVALQCWQSPDGLSPAFPAATSSDPQVDVLYAETAPNIGNGAWLRTGNNPTQETAILAAAVATFPDDMNNYSTTIASSDGTLQVKPDAGSYTPFANPPTVPAKIRMPSAAVPNPGADGHLVIVQPGGIIFEASGAIKLSDGRIVCPRYNLTDPSGLGGGESNGVAASMVPVFAGVMRLADVNKTTGITIPHAMRITVPGNFISTEPPKYPALAFDRTALSNATAYNGPNAVPMGSRLAIPPTVNLAARTFESAHGQAIAQAAQTYGFIVTDRGGAGITLFTERSPTTPALATFNQAVSNDLAWIFDNVQKVVPTAGPLVTSGLKFDGASSSVAYPDSALWDFPDADWTIGILFKIDTATGTAPQYLFSCGGYQSANAINVLIYKSGATTPAPGVIEVSLRGAGTTALTVRTPAHAEYLDGAWRLLTIERVKSNEALSVYVTPLGGARTLLIQQLVSGLGAVAPGTPPTLATRAPATAGNNTWLAGSLAYFFKMTGKLTLGEVDGLAAGASLPDFSIDNDAVVGAFRSLQIHTILNSLTSPIPNTGTGGALAATLTGTVLQVTGPTFKPRPTKAIRLDNDTAYIRYADAAIWDFPDADWTLGIWLRVDNNVGTTQQFIVSNGGYGSANTVNFLLNEAGSTAPNRFEVALKGAGATTIVAQGPTNATLANAAWRLWLIERVKSTETLNLYCCDVNGNRVLYKASAAGATASLGAIAPTLGLCVGTRANATPGSLRWFDGAVYEMFKMNSLLSAIEVKKLAAGLTLANGLGEAPAINTVYNTLTTPIANGGLGGATDAAINGKSVLTTGPIF